MENGKQTQGERLKQILKSESKTQTWLSEQTGISTVTISRWINGKAKISDLSAFAINQVLPDYSIEYILGYSEYPNEKARAKAKLIAEIKKFSDLDNCVSLLIKLNGFDIEYEDEINLDPDTEDPDIRVFYVLSRGDQNVTITGDQYEALVDEICAYTGMRLGQIFDRGCW